MKKISYCHQMKSSLANPMVVSSPHAGALPKLMFCLISFICVTYIVLLISGHGDLLCSLHPLSISSRNTNSTLLVPKENQNATDFYVGHLENSTISPKTELQLKHIVFGIAASEKLWEHRKNYIKLWWRPKEMRGIVWLDKPVKVHPNEGLPPVKISGDTSKFAYKNKEGQRSGIRISRIVSETLRLGMEDVRWFVMGDDDTVFVTENLVRVLSKYDHNQFYYIGSSSESHLQNIFFSYNMAYGGGGFAISYPLAKELERMQDKCIQRYPTLYGSDDRIQACMAELGVPLTKEVGFHQFDVYGNLYGLLASHPVTPLVSLHHLDVVEPIFPNMTQVEALQKLMVPMKLDSAGLIQQSMCYSKKKRWSVSVSWGFAVQITRGKLPSREMEMVSRTFYNWHRNEDFRGFPFNTKPVSRDPCQKPFVFHFSKVISDPDSQQTVTEYVKHQVPHPDCKWKIPDPSAINRIIVYKRADPHLWNKSPRRNCCRVLPLENEETMSIDVGVCREGETTEGVKEEEKKQVKKQVKNGERKTRLKPNDLRT